MGHSKAEEKIGISSEMPDDDFGEYRRRIKRSKSSAKDMGY